MGRTGPRAECKEVEECMEEYIEVGDEAGDEAGARQPGED